MAGFTTTSRELSLQEMLADPIVQIMMTRDGVTKEDVTGLLRTVRERMVTRQMEKSTKPATTSPAPSLLEDDDGEN